jgi:hypothetical protein
MTILMMMKLAASLVKMAVLGFTKRTPLSIVDLTGLHRVRITWGGGVMGGDHEGSLIVTTSDLECN